MSKAPRRPIKVRRLDRLGSWYTLQAGAAELGLTTQAVYEGIRRYQLTVVQLGGKLLLFRPDTYRVAAEKAAKSRRS